MQKLVMSGACGRMGRMILKLAAQDRSFKIHGALEASNNELINTDAGYLFGSQALGVSISDDAPSVLKKADVLIDFSHFSALPKLLQAAVKTSTPCVIGTTNIDRPMLNLVKKASQKIPIVQSPNMSVGVNLLFRLAELTSQALHEGYDIEIAETHHKMKKDAPSGTALQLLEIIANARKKNLKKDVVYGRQGEIGARPKGQIGMSALRGGDVVGDHTVYYLGDGERIELTHRASSREAFARGALLAAKYVAKRKSGLYNMLQVLTLQ